MKFLAKTDKSGILSEGLDYKIKSQRSSIRQFLVDEQKNFCAYSERYIKNTDSVDIEHFDGRLKPTPQDSYYNWYGVISWFNSHKPKKIEPFLPILSPSAADLGERIQFEHGIYKIVNEGDTEAQNLINYLGLNKPELYSDRNNHIKRIMTLFELLGEDINSLLIQLSTERENLSFSTAIEAKFGVDLNDIIFK